MILPVSMDTGFYFMDMGVRKRKYESNCIKWKASNRI